MLDVTFAGVVDSRGAGEKVNAYVPHAGRTNPSMDDVLADIKATAYTYYRCARLVLVTMVLH